MEWTDTKERTITVSGGGKCSIVSYDFPERANVNIFNNFKIVCHVDEGIVYGYLGILNHRTNPGNMIVEINGREYEVKPDETLVGKTSEQISKCRNYGLIGKIKFTKEGNWTLSLLAGIGMNNWTDRKILQVKVYPEYVYWVPLALGASLLGVGLVVMSRR